MRRCAAYCVARGPSRHPRQAKTHHSPRTDFGLSGAIRKQRSDARRLEDKVLYAILKSISIKYDRYIDWNRRDDIEAELKVDQVLVPARHGYPSFANDEVCKEIFGQAENLKKYRGAI